MFRQRSHSRRVELSYAPVTYYPQSYTDFMLPPMHKEELATVSFEALCSFLEGVVDLASAGIASLESLEAFMSIIESLPKNTLIPVSINKTDKKMLVNSRFIFVDQESDFILRPFFQKAILQSLERDDHAYLMVINRYFETLSEENGSNEQLLKLIDIFISERYFSLEAEQENLRSLQRNVAEKENSNKLELLRLNASVQEKTNEIARLTRHVGKQLMKKTLEEKELSDDEVKLTASVHKKTAQTEVLKKQIADELTKSGDLQSDILKVEQRLIEMQNDFFKLKQDEIQQKIEHKEIKQQHHKFTHVTTWLAQKIEDLHAELNQKLQEETFQEKTLHDVPSSNEATQKLFSPKINQAIVHVPITPAKILITSPKKIELTPKVNPSVRFADVETTFAPGYTPSRQAPPSNSKRVAIQSPAIERVSQVLKQNLNNADAPLPKLSFLDEIAQKRNLKSIKVSNDVQGDKAPVTSVVTSCPVKDNVKAKAPALKHQSLKKVTDKTLATTNNTQEEKVQRKHTNQTGNNVSDKASDNAPMGFFQKMALKGQSPKKVTDKTEVVNSVKNVTPKKSAKESILERRKHIESDDDASSSSFTSNSSTIGP